MTAIKNTYKAIKLIVASFKAEVNAAEALDFVCTRYHINNNQAKVFAAFVSCSDKTEIELTDISNVMGIGYIQLARYTNDIEMLVKKSLLNCVNKQSRQFYHISDEVLSAINDEGLLCEHDNIILSASITKRKLFFNGKEEDSLRELRTLLMPRKYNAVIKRLKKYNMNIGFTCLFYGAPGTGKTESTFQIARETGRNIMLVNISSLKSSYVGESEKNIKSVFDDYRLLVSKCSLTPILLFNEADAIISKRINNPSSSVEKMDNAIQNIILQELENFEGILIATTNLEANLDSAFERRFLYKIKFDAPQFETRLRIWKSLVRHLDEKSIEHLADAHNLSGAQISNVVRKAAISHALTGKKCNLAKFEQFCKDEIIGSQYKPNRIGF